ncbi:alpha/beta fold hydrolase [Longitalea luteola]|uniref:alpha/beta fold hydrolase n=1 Tax=Longitalea luteola TaxID=2812563 RepID=UPI001A96135D|nr:alpha/beta hydrolase [Longitalea luteola]
MAIDNNILFDGKPVFYRKEGSGQPVVLIHGFSEDGTVWENQVEYLKSKFQLIIPDLPGSGQSPMNGADWSMEYFAECIRSILDKENITKTSMIGHSMGGYITLAFAEQYPDRLHSFGLFHSTAFADSEEKKTARRRGIEFIQQNGAAKFLEQSIPNLFSEITKKRQPELVQKILARYTNFVGQSLVNYYQAMMVRPDRTQVLKNFSGPVLFIMGKHDTAVPYEQGMQQSYMPGLSYIHTLEHSGHMGMWEEPELSNVFLEEFLMHGQFV